MFSQGAGMSWVMHQSQEQAQGHFRGMSVSLLKSFWRFADALKPDKQVHSMKRILKIQTLSLWHKYSEVREK